jgi:2-haloacid dehalogenase
MATMTQADAAGIRALAFDAQGTCVDFVQPILRMGGAANRAR